MLRSQQEMDRRINEQMKQWHDLSPQSLAEQHTVHQEFPFLVRVALEFAIFRTYAFPSMSRLLVATGEFSRCPAKRTEDTSL
jgi:hypothetical protein